MSEYGGRIARHALTKSSDLLFFAGPCTGGSSWARLNKTRGIDTAEKTEAKQKEFWKLSGRFVEIKRHAMTKHAAILFELPGSCEYWKDERLHEVVHDGTTHECDPPAFSCSSKPALACIVRGNPRRRQTAARENHTTLTV